jgi:hypothetical protein
MKHLRKFNEAQFGNSFKTAGLSSNEFNELKEFSENCLAYLLDEGFELELVDRNGRESNDPSFDQDAEYFWVDLYGPAENGDTISYSWDQIKDYYIPFLKLVQKRYILTDGDWNKDLVLFKIEQGADVETAFKRFEVEDVIDDKITSDSIYSVSIKVSSKK